MSKHRIDINFFPNWIRKAVTFSIDDGNIPMDKKFLDIMKPAGFKGTFNLCSDRTDYMSAEEYRKFYNGFEIANHVKYHPFATNDAVTRIFSDELFDNAVPEVDALYRTEIEGLYKAINERGTKYLVADSDCYKRCEQEGRSELEEIFGKGSVRGFVWPYDKQNNKTLCDYLEAQDYYGIRFSPRSDDITFSMPSNRKCWSCTAWHTDIAEKSKLFEQLPDNGQLKFFCLGIHSVDYETHDKWEELKSFASLLGNKPNEYYYATVGEIFDYESAIKSAEISENKIANNSDLTLYIKIDGNKVMLPPNDKIVF